MTVYGMYSVADLRRAVGAKRLGIFPALPGWKLDGDEIEYIAFERNRIVRFLHRTNEHPQHCFAVFQDRAPLDD